MAELAKLLDDVRPLIIEARQGGAKPRFIELPPDAYDAVATCKRPDGERGMPIMVLGMEVVRADARGTAPRVY